MNKLTVLEGNVADGRISSAWTVYHDIKHVLSLHVRGIIRDAIRARKIELEGGMLSKRKQEIVESFHSLFKKM